MNLLVLERIFFHKSGEEENNIVGNSNLKKGYNFFSQAFRWPWKSKTRNQLFSSFFFLLLLLLLLVMGLLKNLQNKQKDNSIIKMNPIKFNLEKKKKIHNPSANRTIFPNNDKEGKTPLNNRSRLWIKIQISKESLCSFL